MIGRSLGFQLGKDLIIEDASGFVPLRYGGKLVGAEVTARGWYRRTPTPMLEVLELIAADGQPLRTRSWPKLLVLHPVAMVNAVDKLTVFGPALPFPHSSSVQGAERLRELRPRAGRSSWRSFYRRLGDVLVIAALGPEAEADKEWDRTAFAREVAKRVITYRVEHDLSQAELGKQLRMAQSAVARLEAGEREPSLGTLARLAHRLGIQFHIDITPTGLHVTA